MPSVLEPLAAFEEAMGAALAADADQRLLLIVDAAHQPVGAFGEETVRRAFEEQERRTRLELRIATQQLGVPSSLPRCSFSSRARSWNTFRPRASFVTREAQVEKSRPLRSVAIAMRNASRAKTRSV